MGPTCSERKRGKWWCMGAGSGKAELGHGGGCRRACLGAGAGYVQAVWSGREHEGKGREGRCRAGPPAGQVQEWEGGRGWVGSVVGLKREKEENF